MKNIFKNKVVTVVVLLATLVLAGIAVFTAIRLYQLRQESVAPNAPSSEPGAIGFNTLEPTSTPGSCSQLSFSLATLPPSAAPGTCIYSVAPTTLTMGIGQTRNFDITISGDPGSVGLRNSIVTSRNTTIATVTPSQGEPFCPPGAGSCADEAYVVRGVRAGTTIIDVKSPTNQANGSPLCSATVNITVTAASIVTEPPTAPPTTPPGSTPPATAAPTPISCNNTCSTTSDCQSDLVCSAGKCRHPNCTTETDCNCSVATATPTIPGATNPPGTQTTLPATGFNLPTIIGGGLGILVILGALLLLI